MLSKHLFTKNRNSWVGNLLVFITKNNQCDLLNGIIRAELKVKVVRSSHVQVEFFFSSDGTNNFCCMVNTFIYFGWALTQSFGLCLINAWSKFDHVCTVGGFDDNVLNNWWLLMKYTRYKHYIPVVCGDGGVRKMRDRLVM